MTWLTSTLRIGEERGFDEDSYNSISLVVNKAGTNRLSGPHWEIQSPCLLRTALRFAMSST